MESKVNAAITCSVLGVLLAVVTGWLGGEMVTGMGVGVDPGANLNSPNSLSGRPASSTDVPWGTIPAA